MPLTCSGGIICGPHQGSFAVRDHLRSSLGIISGLGIICCWGSFAALYSGVCGRVIRGLYLNHVHSGIPAPGISSDWLLLTVYVNILSVCLKQSEAWHGERDTRAWFWGVKIYSSVQNVVENVSDQSSLWIDFRKSLQFVSPFHSWIPLAADHACRPLA